MKVILEKPSIARLVVYTVLTEQSQVDVLKSGTPVKSGSKR